MATASSSRLPDYDEVVQATSSTQRAQASSSAQPSLDSLDGAAPSQTGRPIEAVSTVANEHTYAEMNGGSSSRTSSSTDDKHRGQKGEQDGLTLDVEDFNDRLGGATQELDTRLEEEQTEMNARRDARKASDIDDDDDEDLVAMTHEDTVLQDGGYEQVGNTSRAQPPATRSSAETRKALMRRIGINLLLILSWFFFSTLMNVYNSWFFSDKRKKFSYPLFVTSIHMTVQFAFATATMVMCARNRKIVPRRKNGQRARPSRHDWLSKVVPCALATALDIGLSNISLKTITLSFYTMCKSSNLAFVLIFAFLFGLEKMRVSLIGIIAIITIGVVMMVAAETEFVLEGAVEVLSASALGGLRWALMQILLCRRSMGMDNPIATMFWLSPLMAAFMIFGSFVLEDWRVMFTSDFFIDTATAVQTISFMILPGFIVICMTLSEFALIMRTSVMTLSVAGIFKEILTILLSIAIFGDELTPINVTGLCIALSGIALYNYLKWRLLVNKASVDGETGFKVGQRKGGHPRFVQVLDNDDDWSGDEEEDTRMINGDVRAHEVPGSTYGASDARSVAMSTAIGTGAVARQKEPVHISPPRPSLSDVERGLEHKHTADDDEMDEAEMRAWESSGIKRTGNGYYDGESDDDTIK